MAPFSRLETASLFSAGTERYVLLDTAAEPNTDVLRAIRVEPSACGAALW